MRSALRRGRERVVSFLFPARCFACFRPLGCEQSLGACPRCWAAFEPVRLPACGGCGLPLPAATDLAGPARGRCSQCVLGRSSLDGVRAAFVYDGLARSFLLRAKFGGRRELLEPLGRQLASLVALEKLGRGSTVVVPVPSNPCVHLRRGFNPALELARPVALAAGLPVRSGLLRRRLWGLARSKRLGAAARRRAVAKAFRASRKARGERVLLVDDVITTGATAEQCACRLKEQGAASVRLLAWAVTPLTGRHGDL